MIFALIGEAASGKSSIEKELSNSGIKRIILYTTRPARSAETNNGDYYFIDYSELNAMNEDSYFLDVAKYGDWYYGLSLDQINYLNEDYIVVTTVKGYKKLIEALGHGMLTVIYIKVNERERLLRQLKRGDDIDEVIRRLHADRIDFADAEKICDYTITKSSFQETIHDIYQIISIKTDKSTIRII
jgi:guanylate kinase